MASYILYVDFPNTKCGGETENIIVLNISFVNWYTWFTLESSNKIGPISRCYFQIHSCQPTDCVQRSPFLHPLNNPSYL